MRQNDLAGVQKTQKGFVRLHAVDRFDHSLLAPAYGALDERGRYCALALREVAGISRELEVGKARLEVLPERLLAAVLVRALPHRVHQHVDQHDQERDDGGMAPIELPGERDQEHARTMAVDSTIACVAPSGFNRHPRAGWDPEVLE